MVRRADQDDVEILLPEHLAIVAVRARLFPRLLAGATMSAAPASMLLVDVAERNDLNRRHLIRRSRSLLPYQPVPIRPTR